MYRIESYESTVSIDSTELSTIQASQAEFEGAKSIEDIQRLTIAFLRGEKTATSYHFGPLLLESTTLVEKLVRLNELGFITTNSQPGGHDSWHGHKIQKRLFVEGILPRRHLNQFLADLYCSAGGTNCFVAILDNEMTYEEIRDLQGRDLYWVSKYARSSPGSNGGFLHITECTQPCQAFQTCAAVYPEIKEEYVSLFIMDRRWGNQSTELLDLLATTLLHRCGFH